MARQLDWEPCGPCRQLAADLGAKLGPRSDGCTTTAAAARCRNGHVVRVERRTPATHQ